MNGTPERITIYHDKEVGMLAQRAESLTINEASINATRTQEIPGRTIDPVTGHVPGADPADNLAVFRAFGLTNLTPREMGVVVVAVEVAEERHHPDLEEQDMGRLSLHTWTTNYMARVLTSSQETNGRPKNLLPNGTSIGASILTP